MQRTQADCAGPARRVVPQNGHTIRVLREKDGYSQQGLAKVIGIHQSGLSHIELEQRAARMTTLNKIARALGVPVVAILREPSESEPGSMIASPLPERPRTLAEEGRADGHWLAQFSTPSPEVLRRVAQALREMPADQPAPEPARADEAAA